MPQSILYDNTTLAVARILGDGRRQRTRVFSELQSHYLFEDRFGRPGKGNDKGKVEGLVGYVRRNFLVPIPPGGEPVMTNKSTMLLEHNLKQLKIPTFLREYDKLASQCASEGADHPDYLLRLSELELIDRHHRMVERRIKAARFPTTKSLDTFDFLSMPSLNKALVLELAREYIERPRATSSLSATVAPARPISPSGSVWLRVRGDCPWASPPPLLWFTS